MSIGTNFALVVIPFLIGILVTIPNVDTEMCALRSRVGS